MLVDIGEVRLLPDGRASFEDTFMAMAVVLGKLRGDCTRRKVGAIIFDPETGDLIQAGYNGMPSGVQGCLRGGCERGKHYKVTVAFGEIVCGSCLTPWPCVLSVPPGSSYDTGPGSCGAIHAEANAVFRAGLRARGMTMAVTEEPCDGCLKYLRGARLKRVVTPTSEFNWDLCWTHDNGIRAPSGADRADPGFRRGRQAHRDRAVPQRRRLQEMGARLHVHRRRSRGGSRTRRCPRDPGVEVPGSPLVLWPLQPRHAGSARQRGLLRQEVHRARTVGTARRSVQRPGLPGSHRAPPARPCSGATEVHQDRQSHDLLAARGQGREPGRHLLVHRQPLGWLRRSPLPVQPRPATGGVK